MPLTYPEENRHPLLGIADDAARAGDALIAHILRGAAEMLDAGRRRRRVKEQMLVLFEAHATLEETKAALWRRAIAALTEEKPAGPRAATLGALGDNEERVASEMRTLALAGPATEERNDSGMGSLAEEWPGHMENPWDGGEPIRSTDKVVRRRCALLLAMRAESPWTEHDLLDELDTAGFELDTSPEEVSTDLDEMVGAGLLHQIGPDGVGISPRGWRRLLVDGFVSTVRATIAAEPA